MDENKAEKVVPRPEDVKDLPPIKKKKKRKILSETDMKIKKARRTRVSIAAFVLLIAVGVFGNWYYENSNISANIEPLINSHKTKTLGQAEYVDATTQPVTESEYFASARMDRQKAREESLAKLQAVIDSTTQGEEAKQSATEKIARISGYISTENKIETLVTAKNVKNCIAIINDKGDRVDIIVDVEDLNDALILQIKEIAMEQLDVDFEKVSIIQSK